MRHNGKNLCSIGEKGTEDPGTGTRGTEGSCEGIVGSMITWLIKFIFRWEDTEMAVIYAALIVKGKKTFAQVPEKLREQVRQVLTDLELEGLAED